MSTQSTDRIPVGVIGVGRMGKLHTRVFSQMPSVELVGVYDGRIESAQQTAENYNCKAFETIEELLPKVKAVVIAVPTIYHLDVATQCLNSKVACLIEKPLAKDSTEGRKIVELARQVDTVVQVGHVERFNPVVRAMKKLNIKPHFIEVHRISPLTFRSIDVGVVLDMMIHDIDIVLSLTQSKLAKLDAVGVGLMGDVEDICNARLTFESGCVANITASRVSLKTERKLRLFSQDAYVSLDYQKKAGMVVHRTGNLEAIRTAVGKIRSGEITDLSQLNYTELVNVEELKIDDTEPLRAELDSFIHAVKTKTRPEVSAEDGLAAVDIAEQITRAVAHQKLV